jgi:hypothetical protein
MQKLAFQAAQSVAGTNSGKCMQILARGIAVPAIQTYAKASLSSSAIGGWHQFGKMHANLGPWHGRPGHADLFKS